jgi:hypothetical protein
LKKESPEQAATDEKGPDDRQPPQDGGEGQLSQRIEDQLRQVKHDLAQDPDNPASAKAAKVLADDYLLRAQKYEDQKRKLAGGNSYSKTDVDATFMRMKDDVRQKGQLKAAYNIQTGTENQFVVGFSLHQEAGDTTCMIPHLKKVKRWLGKLPAKIDSDAS